jgi:tryptophanyl-tRNA synthetase
MEMTRDLAERFNNKFGDVFPIPEAYVPDTAARVMSLTDPTSKMSKSDPQVKSRVTILDDPDVIRKRIRSAVTDSDPEVRYDTAVKPGISNLLDIMASCTGRSVESLVAEYSGAGYGAFKDAVADAVIDELAPFRAAHAAIRNDDVRQVLRDSGFKGRELADSYMRDVRAATGLKRF